MTERTTGDSVDVTCSVSAFGTCEYNVMWLREGEAVKPENKEQFVCSASVSFLNTSRPDSLRCKVKKPDGGVLHFPFGLQASNGQIGEMMTNHPRILVVTLTGAVT